MKKTLNSLLNSHGELIGTVLLAVGTFAFWTLIVYLCAKYGK